MAEVQTRTGESSPVDIPFSREAFGDIKHMASESQEKGEMAEPTADERFAQELRDRPEYNSALRTLRRFREMVGNPEPSRPVPETTRGKWTKPETDAVGWRPRN